ncbi:Rieske (2Fe-2S) protein [Sphingomonas oryzagri]|uniref:Rieske (2Fe-2S) protein n=1 Tax=Sphingomonas oryzagri TaxID=3042314 RepID=A0ABT6MWF7_9SPHN|nr:Rieske (2Fe-2S) protein [Sphingomonas oryzagri]MDH7637344.1 Rieske (2Fe-2S) protein [Sphingomonas oryzagri]
MKTHVEAAMGHGNYHRAVCLDQLEEGQPAGLVLQGWPVMLVVIDGRVHATLDRCPHAASRLSTGRIRRGAVMCPLHGARFELEGGRCVGGSYKPLKIFDARISEGWVEVDLPIGVPGFEHMPVDM